MSPLSGFWGITISLLIASTAYAGKLAIVIDDFGYRPAQENQILLLSPAISVAVLPNAPHARQMALTAHQRGHEVLIHLPMAPLSKQPLEKDTLHPDMSEQEIARIIRQAVDRVPGAVGLNNHMGSAMTASLPGMQKVMHVLNHYPLYFLDSMTIANSQSTQAAKGTHVQVIKRRIFLDDTQGEADIREQFLHAVRLAQRDGHAIAIGHPHPTTVRVLRQMLAALPADITLVPPSQLLADKSSGDRLPQARPSDEIPSARHNDTTLHVIRTCPVHPQPIPASRAFGIVLESIRDSQAMRYIKTHFIRTHVVQHTTR